MSSDVTDKAIVTPIMDLTPEDLRNISSLYPPRRKRMKEDVISSFVAQRYPRKAAETLLQALGRDPNDKKAHLKIQRISHRFCRRYYFTSLHAEAKDDLAHLESLHHQLTKFLDTFHGLTKRQHDVISLALASSRKRNVDPARPITSRRKGRPSPAETFTSILSIIGAVHANSPLAETALRPRPDSDRLDSKAGLDVKPYELWQVPLSALLEHFRANLAEAVTIANRRVDMSKGRKGKRGNPQHAAKVTAVRRLLKLRRSEDCGIGQIRLAQLSEGVLAPLLPDGEGRTLSLSYEAQKALEAVKSKSSKPPHG